MKYIYSHPEDFEGVEFPDFSQFSGNIILYGAGINGMICAFSLMERGIDFICFADGGNKKTGKEYCGKQILSLSEIAEKYPNAVIISDVYCPIKEIGDWFESHNYRVFPCVPLFFGVDLEKCADYISSQSKQDNVGKNDDGYYFREVIDAGQVFEWIDECMVRHSMLYGNKRTISRAINLDITDKCSLKCLDCLGLKAYYEHPCHTSYDDLEKAVNNLLALNHFRRFHILGGEPFLHPDLDKIIYKIASDKTVDTISILTNATIVPKPNVLTALKEANVLVRISYYGKLSSKVKELTETCKEWGINCRVHSQRWLNIGKFRDTILDDKNTLLNYEFCCQRRGAFWYLRQGKIFICPFAANAFSFGNINSKPSDFVEIVNPDLTPKVLFDRLTELYYTETPNSFCRYCNGWSPISEETVPVALQIAGSHLTPPKFN